MPPSPSAPQLYERILLKRGDEVDVKGVRPTDRFINVLAKEKASGMEVYSQLSKPDDVVKPFKYVMLIPWARIAQVDRAQEAT